MNYALHTLNDLSAPAMLSGMSIGPAIAHFMRVRKLNQTQLADAAGIGQSDVSRIINGKQDLTVSTLSAIAKALEVSECDLFQYAADTDPAKARWTELYRQLSDDERSAALKLLEPRAKYSA